MPRIVGVIFWSVVLAIPLDGVARESDVLQVKQGGVLEVTIEASPNVPGVVEGMWRGRRIPFFLSSDSTHVVGFVGADLASKVGRDPFIVTIGSFRKSEIRRFVIEVKDVSFPVQTLTLPGGMVDLNADTLKRVQDEATRLRTLFAQTTTPRVWADHFIVPLEGDRSGSFGRCRVINGQKKNPHTGEDIVAPFGAEVRAANRGIVRLSTEQFFSGKSILLDHGLGLFTMYFHLSKMLVAEGDVVERGAVIGLVGASGRATGPHLHWGARLNNARVDPYELIRLNVGLTHRVSADKGAN